MANQAQRAQAEYPGAAVVARPKNGILLDTGNGHTVAVIGLKPDYHLPDGTEIDTAWVAESVDGFQWGMTTAGYHARARSVLNAGDLVRFTHPDSGQWVIFDPQSINWVNQDNSREQIAVKAAVNAVAGTGDDDDLLRWANGYGTGRHFSYRCVPERLEKLITFDTAGALPTPAAWLTGTIWFEAEFVLKHSEGLTLWLDGAVWEKKNNVRVKTSGRIEFKDAGGNVLFRLDAPFARDANGETTGGEYEVRAQSGTYFCTVRIPRPWLLAAAYPVVVDPTLDLQPDATAGIDTFIQENSATTNYGTNALLTATRSPGGSYRHVLLRFDLTSIDAGATCDAADLYLHTADTFNRTHGIFILSVTDWTESGATWNTKDGTNAWPGSGGASTSGTDYEADATRPTITGAGTENTQVTADLTSGTNMTAAKIASFFGGYLNLIIGNYGTDTSQYWHSSEAATASYRPRIVIDYTNPVTDGAASVTATATATGAAGVQRPGAASTNATATTAGAGSMTRGAFASISAAATTSGAAGVIRGAAAAISGIATAIGAAIRTLAGLAGITATATATGAGTVVGPVVQPGHVTMTATLNATVTMTTTGAGT